VEPKDGTVWRTGANEATVFEVDKDVKINGQTLPAGNMVCLAFPEKNRGLLF